MIKDFCLENILLIYREDFLRPRYPQGIHSLKPRESSPGFCFLTSLTFSILEIIQFFFEICMLSTDSRCGPQKANSKFCPKKCKVMGVL